MSPPSRGPRLSTAVPVASGPRQRAHTLPIQALHVKQRFPHFAYRWNGGNGTWIGSLQPRDCSPSYRVRIQYRIGGVPRVHVTRPSLKPNAPHLYSDGTLCLYWPREWRWHGAELIAETIIPWTALWLLYYELWLDTDKWLGPSSHGEPLQAPKDAQRAA